LKDRDVGGGLLEVQDVTEEKQVEKDCPRAQN
jgi:hypothetical protein